MPTNDADWIKENRESLLKQSDMLLSVVTRMATNSLEVKKVGLTVWAAIVGFGFSNSNPVLFVLAFVAFALFGVLDVYYLHLERKFRGNFNRLTRLINGYGSSKDDQWLQQMKADGKNFLIPDLAPNFLKQLFSKESVLKSWANLPYLITLLITIALLIAPLPTAH